LRPLLLNKGAVSEFYAQGVPAFLSYSQHPVMNEVIGIKVWLDAGFWEGAKPESGFYFGEVAAELKSKVVLERLASLA